MSVITDNSQKYTSNIQDLKYYHVFGIFCTLIGIILIVPKISNYYRKKEKREDNYKDRMLNTFTMLGCLFIIYGLKEIFFKQPNDTEIALNKLIFYLRETDQINVNIYNKLSSYMNHSVLEYLK